MEHFPIVDTIILGAYFLATVLIGLLANRILKKKADTEAGYFLGDRSMPGYLTGISNAVNIMNSDVMPTYMGVALAVGLPVCWFYFSRAAVAVLLAGMLFFARWKQLGVATGPEFFSIRFGLAGGGLVRGITSVYSVLFGIIPWMGAGLLAAHLIFSSFFGYDSKAVTLVMILPLMLLCIWITGYAGVLITNLFQTVIIVVACIAVCVGVLINFGGPAGLTDSIRQAFSAADAANILGIWPQSGNPVINPALIVTLFMLTGLGVGANVAVDGQRVISCKNAREAVKVSIWTQLTLFVMLLLVTLPALGLLAKMPELFTAEARVREGMYGIMIRDFLPVGLKGLTLAALAAAVMSTVSTQLNYSAQTLTHDVAGQMLKFSPQRGVMIGRIAMLAVMLMAIGVVYYADSLIGIAIAVIGVTGSSLLVGWGYWWYWRINIYSWYTAYVGGPFIYLACRKLLPLIPWWAQQQSLSPNHAQMMEIHLGLVSLGVTTLVTLIVTYLTPPDKMEVLMEFYRRARPMGYWKPVREALEARGELRREPRNLLLGGIGTALVGAAWFCTLIMGLSELYVGNYLYGTAFGVVTVAAALWFKRLFNWHLTRME